MSYLVVNQRSWVKSLVIVVLAAGMTACGSGGGDDDYTPISYTGSLTAADITSSNYEEMGAGSFTTGSAGGAGGFIGSQQQSSEQAKPGVTIVSNAISQSVKDSLYSPREDSLSGVTVTDYAVGPCGGSLSASLTFSNLDDPNNPTLGDFTGTFSFRNYCESNVTIDGSVVISSGSFSNSFDNMSMTTTSNLVIRDDISGATYKAENYAMSLTSNLSYDEITVSGRFYEPVHGYANVTTITPMRTNAFDFYPSSGVIKVVEESTLDSVTLTALNNTQYQLDYDQDNNGSIEVTVTGNWVDL